MSTSWAYVDSDEEFADEGEKAFRGKTATIVLIDCTPEMFQAWKADSEEVPFRAAIKCCQAMWRNKVVASDKDLVSLVFVGSKNSKNSSNFENLYQLQELSPVKVQMIEELNLIKSSDDYDGFEEKIGSSENYDLKDVFWLAKIIFDEGKAATYQKKIMYFTRCDNPHAGKSNIQQEAVRKFKDIGKVQFSVVAFNEEFDLNNFYSKIVEDESSLVKEDNLESLMKIVRVKQRLRRPLSKCTFEIAPNVKLAVGFYSFVRTVRKPPFVRINKRTNVELQKTVNEFHAETGMPVLKSEDRKMAMIQGEKAIFTSEEIKQAKQGFERGVKLIGFMDTSDFNHFSWYRSGGYFLYPDEELITGSRDLFVALLKRCYSLKKIALVKMVLSRSRSPKLACLIPCLEDDLFPQGFHVFLVPFSDEMRKYDMEFNNQPTPELVTLIEKVIKKTTNKGFDLLDVYSPAVQYHWREIERIALDLDEEEQEEFHDFTEPNEDLMLERLGSLPDDVQQEALRCSSMYEEQKSTTTLRQVNMAMEVKHRRVDKLTIPVLKQFLDSEKVNTYRLKKAELVAAVYAHFGGK